MSLRKRLYGDAGDPRRAEGEGDDVQRGSEGSALRQRALGNAPRQQPDGTVTQQGEEPPDLQRLVQLIDPDGRAVLLTRDEFSTTVLRDRLEATWSDPDELHSVIEWALEESCGTAVVDAAERLREIDPVAERSLATWVWTRIATGQPGPAKQALDRFIDMHGPTAWMLYWRGRIYEEIGNDALADRTFWTALDMEPNHETILGKLAERAEARRTDGQFEIFERAASLPGSWLADCLHVRHLVENDRIAPAVKMAQDLVSGEHADNSQMLSYLTAGLGIAGRPDLAVDLVYDAYDPNRHRARAGLNLLHACVEADRPEPAHRLLRRMLEVGFPGDRDEIAAIEADLRARSQASSNRAMTGTNRDEYEPGRSDVEPLDQPDFEIATHTVENPIWFEGLQLPGWLLDNTGAAPTARIALLPLAAEMLEGSAGGVNNDLAGWGQFSRGLLLYLHEWLELCTDADPVALFPVVLGGGVAITSDAWDPEFVRSVVDPLERVDYVLTGSVRAEGGRTAVRVELWNAAFDERVFEIDEVAPNSDDVSVLMGELRDRIAFALGTFAGVTAGDGPAWYTHPQIEFAPQYLAAQAKLLALSACAAGLASTDDLGGEHEILQWLTNLAAVFSGSRNETAAIMQLAGLALSSSAGSLRYLEFKQQALAVERAYRSPASRAYRRLAPLLFSIFNMGPELRERSAELIAEFADDDAYRSWMARI